MPIQGEGTFQSAFIVFVTSLGFRQVLRVPTLRYSKKEYILYSDHASSILGGNAGTRPKK